MSKTIRARLLVFAALVTTSALMTSQSQAAVYKMDPVHSIVGFSVKHLVVTKVKGRFDQFEGSFYFDEKSNEVSKIIVQIDTNSIDTNDTERDIHLKSPDFFDVKKFPDMKFTADKVIVKQDSPVQIKGHLTMKGVAKPVTLDLAYGGAVSDPMGNEKVGFSLTGRINRKDWGINWNKTLDKGGLTVSDEVRIEIEGQAKKESTAAAPAKK
ncbi:MAG: YceI family protein [Pseudobdellovibrionaceae bacterium]